MPAKKTKSARLVDAPKRTPKRKTAIPAAAPVKRASKPVAMRLVFPPPVEPVEPSRELIEKRAFEIWEIYLRLANDPVRHWLEAEKQLRGGLNPPAGGVA
jgi:hypothetical protein